MNKPKRPSAEATRQKILKAAKSAFLEVGFDGAKTRTIANVAGVHSNLVFHHFKNKEALWAIVKQDIFKKNTITPNYDISSAVAYLKSIINFRFNLFANNADLVKLIQWQQLTENNKALTSNDSISSLCWRDRLKTFQAQGQIKKNIDIKVIVLYITYVTHAPFMQDVIPLTEAEIAQYKSIALESCVNQFSEEK